MPIDRDRVADAFRYACTHHADQFRKSGEEFIVHPVSVAKICAGMRLDTETLCAALLHDTVEDTSASLDEIRADFGDEIAGLVDGVTKLTGLTFKSRDEAQAENYRKMMVAMASDIRVILIKLADRLHNMRTIGAMSKQKQIEKSRETLDIYAPIAHRLGIHAIKWELEDLAFQTLHPRKYNEIKGLVAQQRDDRERYVNEAGDYLLEELDGVGISAEISGRAKHFYSIYAKMTKKGREFNEIYDLTAMRVIVDSVKDCYGAVGVIHALWKPLPGRFKDYIAMPKFNMYQSLHTTVVGPEGRPLEIQIRTREMHDLAELGIAAHWMYKDDPKNGSGTNKPGATGGTDGKLKWLRSLVEWQQDMTDSKEFVETLKVDLFEDEVFVFTPKGEVKSLAAGATPLDFAYEIHTDVGHRCVGAKVNGKIVPLSYQLRSGDICEVLTSKRERGPSRDWLQLVKTTRARNKIKDWFKAENRRDTEHTGRELLQEALRKQGLPAQKIVASPLLADVIREMGFRKGEEFYIALGATKIKPQVVINKVMQKLKQGEPAEPEQTAAHDLLATTRRRRERPTSTSSKFGIVVDGVDDVMLRIAKCCRPVPGDEIVGYISLGRGITIHREDCPNVAVLRKDPERFTPVSWEGDSETSFRVEIEVQGWDRYRLLEDMSRTFADAGINILDGHITVNEPMVRNRFVVEVGDTRTLDQAINRLRNIDAVFDAFRVTPGAGGG
ncbi:MAG: bifunctional (p)ppGpp synthetase/guanosine-3',5'-bis(diphosphate) 3'-pyrophosphohydrolase [Solirubrobacterales bacterium]|nr:bifunctional (p)ppGpp synthetase/guanosine-3',5'-bis(diphosphate) 3'-pyrophosphohydrolase [Solirubrobacterales bacterium]